MVLGKWASIGVWGPGRRGGEADVPGVPVFYSPGERFPEKFEWGLARDDFVGYVVCEEEAG